MNKLLITVLETPMVEDFKGQKMMQPEEIDNQTISGLKKDKFEITLGQSGQMKMMSRLAPDFIFKAISK